MNLFLVDVTLASQWIKIQPCQGYGHLLEIVDMHMVSKLI